MSSKVNLQKVSKVTLKAQVIFTCSEVVYQLTLQEQVPVRGSGRLLRLPRVSHLSSTVNSNMKTL